MSFGAISNSQALAADAQSLGGLKMEAGKSSPQAIQEAAKQFESLFMRELLKSMREATMKSGMLDSPGGDLGTDLLDQQFAVQRSGQPGGLSDLIAQQLKRQMGTPADTAKTDTVAPVKSTPVRPAVNKTVRAPTESQSDFVQQHSKVANEVAQASGIPASMRRDRSDDCLRSSSASIITPLASTRASTGTSGISMSR